jgi:hypothetical protein
MSDALERVYERLLLGMVRRSIPHGHELQVSLGPPKACVVIHDLAIKKGSGYRHDNLADALAALLRDLGVDVPERVSAEEVREAFAGFLHDAEADPEQAFADHITALYASGNRGALLAESILAGAPDA